MLENLQEDQDNQHKYLQIREALAVLVRKLEPGSRLTSERELAKQLGCSFLTVRKAMLMLVEEGLIVRRIGSGTFVADHSTPAVTPAAAEPTAERSMGVLIHAACDSYGLQIITALQRQARAEGIHLFGRMISSLDHLCAEQIDALKKEGCIAAILPWYPQQENAAAAELTRTASLPISLPMPLAGLERHFFQNPQIFGRNLIDSIESIGKYFLAAGWSAIAFLGPDTPESPVLQRNLCGYGSFTSRNQMQSLVGLVSNTAPSMDALANRWKEYAGKLAVISYDDDHALRFLTAMHKCGLGAPEDFGIASFGNSAVALLADPPLTCVYQDFDFPAGWMLKNALALTQGSCAQAQEEPRLLMAVRASCGGLLRLGSALSDTITSFGFHPVLPADCGIEPVRREA